MNTINDSHLKALARAQHFIRSGITSSMEPKHQDQINRDIELIDEVHKYCRQQINEPGLRFVAETFAKIKNGDQSG